MTPPHLRNAAAKLKRQAEYLDEDDPERVEMLATAKEMVDYATEKEEIWAAEHPDYVARAER